MRGYVVMLGILAASWGASYLFIKVAVEDFEPATMMCLRLVLAFGALLPFLVIGSGFRGAVSEIRETGRGGVLLGLINMAIPFTLIAWGEKHIDSGVAAIANSTVPIFVALLAIRFRPSERVTGMRMAGVLLGLVGVGVLTGLNPEGGWWAIAGTLAVVLASLSYAAANLYAPARFPHTSPLVVGTTTTFWAMVILIPVALFQLPDHMPSWKALASVAALGLLGTAFATLILYRMLNTYGSSRTSLVTYLLPPMALFYGVTILDEQIHLNAVLGLVLILAGVALGSGLFQLGRSRTRAEEPAAAPQP
ncbi:MAG TPA: DMT family transporter [Gaiellaceae bacterium]|jgi:drug/metabolite transporter (DMT)-like permease|nr:DMT family transporter [Gaiellaceae bacterium]